MLKKFTEHPHARGETYLEHMCAAWKAIYTLKIIELQCLVHSVFPFLYIDALSSKIKCLEKIANRQQPTAEEELYEVYGGD